MKWLAVFLFSFVCGLVQTVMRAWAAHYLWKWFAPPAGLPPVSDITLFAAAALSILFTHQIDVDWDKKDDPDPNQQYSKIIKNLAVGFLIAASAIGEGWIVKSLFIKQ